MKRAFPPRSLTREIAGDPSVSERPVKLEKAQ